MNKFVFETLMANLFYDINYFCISTLKTNSMHFNPSSETGHYLTTIFEISIIAITEL